MNALLYSPGIFTSTDPHKYAYISKRINPIIIISSDLDSTINFALERHVFGKSQLSPFFFVLKGLYPLNVYFTDQILFYDLVCKMCVLFSVVEILHTSTFSQHKKVVQILFV